jgi:hypothetical protein
MIPAFSIPSAMALSTILEMYNSHSVMSLSMQYSFANANIEMFINLFENENYEMKRNEKNETKKMKLKK